MFIFTSQQCPECVALATEVGTGFARALTRAHQRGLRIAGHGTVIATGEPCVAVTSGSDPDLFHAVLLGLDGLRCDCTAAKHDRACSHRALAHEHLHACTRCQREIEHQRAMARARVAAARRDAAPLYRSNAPISIYRSEMY